MSFSSGDNSGPIANINVTPLVDVMLVLLVIFMITTPIMQQGVEVNLPKATTAPLSGSSEQVVISLTKDGKIFLGAGNQIELTGLNLKLEAVMNARAEADRKLYINADADVSYGDIMQVMAKAHQAGITQIGLVSDPGGGEDEKRKGH